jgi:hypothetical protein
MIPRQENHMNNSREHSVKNQVEIDENIGTTYRASGNIFIAVRTSRGCPHVFCHSGRSSINRFSADSARRMRRYLRECMSEYKEMVTLTYPFSYPSDGATVKNHLRRFLQEVKREWTRTGNDTKEFSAFWFLEFQQRGAPHFHIFCTWAPGREWIARRWYEIVNSEDIRHLKAGTRVEYLKAGRAGTISYASKYAQKQEQKEVPEGYENVGRFWGIVGRRSVMSAATWVSVADSKKSEVQSALSRLIGVVNRLLFEGTLESIKSDEGVRIFICHSHDEMKVLRCCISNLAAKTMRWENMFEDAELME